MQTLLTEMLAWWHALPPEFVFLLTLPFVVGIVGVGADVLRRRTGPRARAPAQAQPAATPPAATAPPEMPPPATPPSPPPPR